MEWLGSLLTCTTISSLLLVFFWSAKFLNRSSKLNRPPGPPGWPVIGNILDLGPDPHQDFYRLKSRYGPVLWLKLGNLNTVVIQSAAAAAELFKKHDLAVADRAYPNTLEACNFISGSLAFGPYNDYWRTIRRVAVSELMAPKRINASIQLTQKCIEKMIQCIREDASESRSKGGSGEIDVEKYVMILGFNMVSNLIFARDIASFKSEVGNEFVEMLVTFVNSGGEPNVVDAFGFLERLDPQGIRRRAEKHLGKLLSIISGLVDERIQQKKSHKGNLERAFVDALLEYEGDGKGLFDKLSEKNISIVLLELFIGGTETTSNTTAFAMGELLRNPNSMKKLREEIDGVVGPSSRAVKAEDLPKLPYLQAVADETLRMHPPVPLLLPRKTREDIEFMGYSIPKGTTVFVNAWAIHKDPQSWEDPLTFKPERFLESNIEHKGQHYEMLPFGSGRRSCVGMPMGNRTVCLTLARLIQSFHWELPANVSLETLDMRELMRVSLRMLTPLKSVPVERKTTRI